MTFQIHGTSCGYNSVLAANSPQASSRTRKQKSAGLAKLAAMKSSLFDDDSSHLCKQYAVGFMRQYLYFYMYCVSF